MGCDSRHHTQRIYGNKTKQNSKVGKEGFLRMRGVTCYWRMADIPAGLSVAVKDVVFQRRVYAR
jgi:hypothetical protein